MEKQIPFDFAQGRLSARSRRCATTIGSE